jgi:hypothetical protein
MIVSLKVSDELYEEYGRRNPNNPRTAMADSLERFVSHDPGIKSVLLDGENLSLLQSALQTSLSDPAELTRLLIKALSVRVDEVEVALTPVQRKSIETNASFFKQTQGEFAKNKIEEGLRVAFGV